MQKPSRPDAVYVVTILAAVLGLLLVSGGVVFVAVFTVASVGIWPLSLGVPDPNFLPVAFALLLLGILNIGVGAGFYYAWPSSRIVGIIASIVTGILSTLTINTGSVLLGGFSVVSPFAILYPLAVIYCLTRMNIRTYFRQM